MRGVWLAAGLALLGVVAPVSGEPRLAVIMDDLGARPAQDRRAIALPGVTCAFLPDAPHTAALAGAAQSLGCEVMLHLPMESAVRQDGGLHAGLDEASLARALRGALAAVPGARGLNNHRGSGLTASRPHMDWLMRELRHHPGLYFVDSRTTPLTQAEAAARAAGVPHTRRDVFLDAPGTQLAVQWRLLLEKARQQGAAVAIAHPLPATLDFLERELPAAGGQGFALRPVSAFIQEQQLALAARGAVEPQEKRP